MRAPRPDSGGAKGPLAMKKLAQSMAVSVAPLSTAPPTPAASGWSACTATVRSHHPGTTIAWSSVIATTSPRACRRARARSAKTDAPGADTHATPG